MEFEFDNEKLRLQYSRGWTDYAAGETPIEGVDKDALVLATKAHGHRHVIGLKAPDELAELVRSLAQPGDYVICLGAGSVTQWAYALPGELAALDKA